MDADDGTDFSLFNDSLPTGGVAPLSPERAVAYFRSLIPGLTLEASAFAADINAAAFALAATTDATLLARVKALLLRALEKGDNIGTAAPDIQSILDAAGVLPANPFYSEMVVRTNLMVAYQTGNDQERQDPDVVDDFPVWRYDGIADGRERPSHYAHFGKYFAADVSFTAVRDSIAGKFDGFSCRCIPTPIYKSQWKQLHAAGARVESIL